MVEQTHDKFHAPRRRATRVSAAMEEPALVEVIVVDEVPFDEVVSGIISH